MMTSILCHPLRTKDSYYDEAYDGSIQGQSDLELGANLAKCSEERCRSRRSCSKCSSRASYFSEQGNPSFLISSINHFIN